MRSRALLSLTLLLCFSPFPATGEPLVHQPLRVGVIQSLTGLAAEYGKTSVQALQLAADEINANSPTKVELLIEDDGTVPKNTASAFQKLAGQQVDVVIGSTWDFTSNAILSLAGYQKIPLFVPTCMSDALDLKQSNGFAFSSFFSGAMDAAPFGEWAKARALKSVTFVRANNRWGEIQAAAYAAQAQAVGVRVVDQITSTNLDDSEWRTIIPRIQSKAPEAIALQLNRNDIELFMKRARELKLQAQIFGAVNVWEIVRLGDKALVEGVCFTYPFEQIQRESDFNQSYEKRFGEVPRVGADYMVDALKMIHEAYLTVHEPDLTARRLKLRDAIRASRYSGLAGSYQWNEASSFATGKSSLMCVKDGVASVQSSR